jgi:hypothetical protein
MLGRICTVRLSGHPVFLTVGLDLSFYGPQTLEAPDNLCQNNRRTTLTCRNESRETGGLLGFHSASIGSPTGCHLLRSLSASRPAVQCCWQEIKHKPAHFINALDQTAASFSIRSLRLVGVHVTNDVCCQGPLAHQTGTFPLRLCCVLHRLIRIVLRVTAWFRDSG